MVGPGQPSNESERNCYLNSCRDHGVVHPREVDEYFSHGKVTNYWGGSSNATTHLLDAMHYRGMLRIVKREKGIRIYAAHEHAPTPKGSAARRGRLDALVDVVVRIYAPLSTSGLSSYLRRLRYAVPQWKDSCEAFTRAKLAAVVVVVDGVTWYFPKDEEQLFSKDGYEEAVRLLAPFDPLVHDRARLEMLWGWVYRFEAYTPAAKRKLGYYAMPMSWRNR